MTMRYLILKLDFRKTLLNNLKTWLRRATTHYGYWNRKAGRVPKVDKFASGKAEAYYELIQSLEILIKYLEDTQGG